MHPSLQTIENNVIRTIRAIADDSPVDRVIQHVQNLGKHAVLASLTIDVENINHRSGLEVVRRCQLLQPQETHQTLHMLPKRQKWAA